jgi:hypothetical protein
MRGTAAVHEAAQVTSLKMLYLFTPNSDFSDLGLSRKLVSRTIHPSQEKAQMSTLKRVVILNISSQVGANWNECPYLIMSPR